MAESQLEVDRRRVLQTISMAGALSIAGCGGSDSTGDSDGGDGGSTDGGGELGERVPEATFTFLSGFGPSSVLCQNATQSISENVQERLGISTQAIGTEFASFYSEIFDDARQHNYYMQWHTTTPSRIDPTGMHRRMAIDWAGANGKGNMANYADCEYSEPAIGQESATSEERRRELLSNAVETFTTDAVALPYGKKRVWGGIRTDTIEPHGIGNHGIAHENCNWVQKSNVIEGDTMVATVPSSVLDQRNFLVVNNSQGWILYNQNILSGLQKFNENFEKEDVLARNIEVTNSGETVIAELKDGVTFHDGDPITSEDVQFTYSHLDEHLGVYPRPPEIPYDSIEIVDDRTVEFNFTEPYMPFLQLAIPIFGILKKQQFVDAGADENPESFEPDPLIGSGPFQIEELSLGSHLTVVPFEDHVFYDDIEHNVTWRGFNDANAQFQSLNSGDLHVMVGANIDFAKRINEQIDGAEGVSAPGFVNWVGYAQASWGPQKFREFRDAVGKAVNRKYIRDVVFQGENSMVFDSYFYQESHPWYMEESVYKFTDKPEGDEEAARGVLSEAGWGWDDQGNLHYPVDADLSPLWPEGSEPQAEEFPCITNYS